MLFLKLWQPKSHEFSRTFKTLSLLGYVFFRLRPKRERKFTQKKILAKN